MLENGADIRFIEQQLGHAKLEITQIYTAVSIRKLKEVHTENPSRKASLGVLNRVRALIIALQCCNMCNNFKI